MTDHHARRARLRAAVVAGAPDVDAVLVTSPVNVRYLSGFSGSSGALLVPVDDTADPLLATDDRYVLQAGVEAPDLPLVVTRAGPRTLLEQAAGDGLVRVGFEDHDLTVAGLDHLRRTSNGVELVPVGQPVEQLRTVKDDVEVELLRTACRITDEALQSSVEHDRWVGRAERAVAAELEHRMRVLGADGPAFETIVGAGPNSAVPHHRPTDRPLRPGDLVVVDLGARVDGYHADMTRTFVVGVPADWQREIFDVVRAAQRAGRAALRPGAACADVDAAARRVIDEAGHREHFRHGLGHGVGLQIHEAPHLGAAATGSIAPRTTVTVEPGVYLAGRGGVRIEDTLVVAARTPAGSTGLDTASGPATTPPSTTPPSTTLTTTGRDLHVLG